jgi:hypothetical protein
MVTNVNLELNEIVVPSKRAHYELEPGYYLIRYQDETMVVLVYALRAGQGAHAVNVVRPTTYWVQPFVLEVIKKIDKITIKVGE